MFRIQIATTIGGYGKRYFVLGVEYLIPKALSSYVRVLLYSIPEGPEGYSSPFYVRVLSLFIAKHYDLYSISSYFHYLQWKVVNHF